MKNLSSAGVTLDATLDEPLVDTVQLFTTYCSCSEDDVKNMWNEFSNGGDFKKNLGFFKTLDFVKFVKKKEGFKPTKECDAACQHFRSYTFCKLLRALSPSGLFLMEVQKDSFIQDFLGTASKNATCRCQNSSNGAITNWDANSEWGKP